MTKLLGFITIGVLLLLTASSCTKKTTKPAPVEYVLYVGTVEAPGRAEIFAIDTETDTIIDSVEYPGDYPRLFASPDGKYIGASSSSNCTIIYNTTGLQTIGELTCRQHPAFPPGVGSILGFDGWGVKFYNCIDLTIESEDTVWMLYPQVNLPDKSIFGLRGYGEGGTELHTEFVAYDYLNRNKKKIWPSIVGVDGTIHRLFWRFHLHPDGQRVFVATAGSPGRHLISYDLLHDSALFDLAITGYYGCVRVSPNGEEVYLTDPGYPLVDDTPGKIFIYSADNGSLLGEISVQGLDTVTSPFPLPLYAGEIRFHPTKPKVYVACGGNNHLGPILVINTETREILKWLFPDFDHSPQFIDIAPKLN